VRECPKCHGLLESDGSCSCGYGVKRRAVAVPAAKAIDLCSWTDHGKPCPCRAVFIIDHQGYCREHMDRRAGIEPKGRGNYPVKPTARSMHMRQWDAWYPEWLANRAKHEPVPMPAFLRDREPGCDDEQVIEETT